MRTAREPITLAFGRGLAVASVLVIASADTWSQPLSFRALYTNHGANWNEPVGDRDGHSLQIGDATCSVQGGPMDGAVATQQVVWEYDKGIGTLLSSHSVYRKPGAMLVGIARSGTVNLQMAEGRVTGWNASGTLVFATATGSASNLEKKVGNWTARPTGNRAYVIEIKVD